MTKFLLTIILIGSIGYLVYFYVIERKPDVLEVHDKLAVTKLSSYDINVQSVSAPLYNVVITGSVKNIAEFPMVNIIITYHIANTKATVYLRSLNKGEKANFESTVAKVRNSRPSYKIENIKYDLPPGYKKPE